MSSKVQVFVPYFIHFFRGLKQWICGNNELDAVELCVWGKRFLRASLPVTKHSHIASDPDVHWDPLRIYRQLNSHWQKTLFTDKITHLVLVVSTLIRTVNMFPGQQFWFRANHNQNIKKKGRQRRQKFCFLHKIAPRADMKRSERERDLLAGTSPANYTSPPQRCPTDWLMHTLWTNVASEFYFVCS